MNPLLEGEVFVPIPEREGYFWNIRTQSLFSTKKGGIRELRLTKGNRWTEYQDGYFISQDGVKQFIGKNFLATLNREPCVSLTFEEEKEIPLESYEDLFRV